MLCENNTSSIIFLVSQVMMGGSWYKELLSDDGSLPSGADLVKMASQAAAKHLGIRPRPIRSHATLQEVCVCLFYL